MTRPGPHPHRTAFQQCPDCRTAELVGRRGRLVCAAACGFDEPLPTRTPPRTTTPPDDALDQAGEHLTVAQAQAKARAGIARARLTKSLPPDHQPNRNRR